MRRSTPGWIQTHYILVVLVLAVASAHAAGTGRIVGRVWDKATGEPVVGAAVEVKGADLGATTDEDGRYLIAGVPAGTCTIVTSALGFEPGRRPGVVVSADQTATADFRLKTTVILIGDMGPSPGYRSPTFRHDVAQTERILESGALNVLPLSTVGELLAPMPGVTSGREANDLHIRGGRSDDVGYLVNGTQVRDVLTGEPWAGHVLPGIDVRELRLVTGGMNAEYGDAMSGVVEAASRSPSESGADMRCATDAMFPEQGLNFGYRLAQGRVSGALAGDALRYGISGEYSRTNDSRVGLYQVLQPGSHVALEGKAVFNPRRWHLLAPNSGYAVLDGQVSDGQSLSYDNPEYPPEAWKYGEAGNQAKRNLGNRLNLNIQYWSRSGEDRANLAVSAGFVNSQVIRSPRDFAAERADLSGVAGFLDRSGIWARYAFKGSDWLLRNPSDSYVANGETVPGPMPPEVAVRHLYEAYRVNGGASVPENWQAPFMGTENPYGVSGLFATSGDADFHYHLMSSRYLNGTYTYERRKHRVKAGVNLNSHDVRMYENSEPWSATARFRILHARPFTASAYAQDEADFEHFVVQAGVRLDELVANAKVRVFPESIGGSPGVRDSAVPATPKLQISPRLGFTFPFSEGMKLRASLGHFTRYPDFQYLYPNLLSSKEIVAQPGILVGNPDLSAEKSDAFELGFDMQPNYTFEFSIAAYYRDLRELTVMRVVQAQPAYLSYTNQGQAVCKGLEAVVLKKLSDYWYADASYTLSFAQGSESLANGFYWPANGSYFLEYDRRHKLDLLLGFRVDGRSRLRLLRDFDAGVICRYASGLPYTPIDRLGQATGPFNSARTPDNFSIDMRLIKSVLLGQVYLSIFCDIFNLFDSRLVTSVYPATGRPDADGRMLTPGELFWPEPRAGDREYHPGRDPNHDGYITRAEWYNSYVAAYSDLIHTPFNYGPSRRIQLGIIFSFSRHRPRMNREIWYEPHLLWL